jgi:hypothetical protein
VNDNLECLEASSWVLQKVKEICHYVGLSCEGFEGELMALLTTIEVSQSRRSGFPTPNQPTEVKEN